MRQVRHFYRSVKPDFEYCFNVETSAPLTSEELRVLRWLLAQTFEIEHFGEKSFLKPVRNVIEVGPRLDFETAYSTNAVAICHACGVEKVTRLERSRRYLLPTEIDRDDFVARNHDRMTEYPYRQPLESFTTKAVPEKVYDV
jgi:phosphoribosylformylglycinamidine synthase